MSVTKKKTPRKPSSAAKKKWDSLSESDRIQGARERLAEKYPEVARLHLLEVEALHANTRLDATVEGACSTVAATGTTLPGGFLASQAPCPFCDTEMLSTNPQRFYNKADRMYWIQCPTCRCWTRWNWGGLERVGNELLCVDIPPKRTVTTAPVLLWVPRKKSIRERALRYLGRRFPAISWRLFGDKWLPL